MHPDHIGGLLNGDVATFPNAVVRIEQHDIEHWLSEANLANAPEEARRFFIGAMISVKPYINSGRLKPFDGDTDLVPGIKAISTRGHTPGHSIYLVESKGQKLMIWGDLMHVAAVQFDEPDITLVYDTDSKKAAAQRKKAYADAVKQGYLVGAAHLSFPGLGHLRTLGKGYSWLPVNYTVLP